MQLRYEEDFIEAAVIRCANGAKDVPALQIARFHREREKLYAILDPDDRNAAFFRVHLDWFREWGLEALLLDVLDEYPLLRQHLAVLAVRKTHGKNDEGAEIYANESGQRNAVLALRPESFQYRVPLQNYLRHEFMHLHDMVDPAFSYSPVLDLASLNHAQQRLTRERYRLLWDITIDGRLAAAGRTPASPRECHAAAFARGYPFWTADDQGRIFKNLWNDPKPRHSNIVSLIADPRGLRNAAGPEPGASCPLCGFPTFAWSDPAVLTPHIRTAIAAEFPAWTLAQGLCGRCREAYEVMSCSRSAN